MPMMIVMLLMMPFFANTAFVVGHANEEREEI